MDEKTHNTRGVSRYLPTRGRGVIGLLVVAVGEVAAVGLWTTERMLAEERLLPSNRAFLEAVASGVISTLH